ncbi:hypothetical protein DIPPA_05091 [Diplonema papillatum]|nr:hypothetical protein DIPPA_05091 [Diplonema papillatum]
MIGPGEWVSTRPGDHWVSRFGPIVLTYRQGAAWWAVLEFAGAFTMGAITAVPTTSHVWCGTAKLACAAVFFALFLLEAHYKPHARPRDNWIDSAALFCEAFAMLSAAVTLFVNEPGHWSALGAQILVFATIGLFVAKAVADVLTEVYLFHTGRRVRLQREEWGLAPFAWT